MISDIMLLTALFAVPFGAGWWLCDLSRDREQRKWIERGRREATAELMPMLRSGRRDRRLNAEAGDRI